MTVYIVFEGIPYEGNSFDSVWLDKAKAEERAEVLHENRYGRTLPRSLCSKDFFVSEKEVSE